MLSHSIAPRRERPTTVLAVDDDRDTARLLCDYLQDYGMAVEVAQTGAQMRAFLSQRRFDMVLLDLLLPDEGGLDLCTWAKEQFPELPVIMLTADDDPESCVEGLGRGADDYVGKPFSPRELLARIKAVLRRTDHADRQDRPERIGSLRYDPAMRCLTRDDGDFVPLTDQESRLVDALLANAGVALARDRLLDLIGVPADQGSDRSVDALISRLRTKLGEHRDVIRTVRGQGYRLDRPTDVTFPA